ncbi:MAG: biotin--[acetyl-CoA-carboxylase] ligase [Bacillota bacterium]|nr:biotin--[acetyl-CoA-carboxylase] ligase [Bacillota bacterium]
MKDKVLELLSETEYVSGEDISRKLGISRAAVWKNINSLKSEGYIIESSTNRGYRIINRPDILTYEEILPFLSTAYIGRKVLHFESLDSTNTRAKEIGSGSFAEGTVIVSEEQLSGRGRLGRSWSSPKGAGIWMSLLLKPETPPTEAYKVTIIAAAAVHKALSEEGVASLIKWPNDIVLNGRKICGILTEMSAEFSRINYLVMGIGINVNTTLEEFPEEIKNKASSLRAQTGRSFNRKSVMSRILNNLEIFYDLFLQQGTIEPCIKICRENSAVIGRQVLLIEGSKSNPVEVLDINDKGHLLIKDGSSIREILSGEISLRAMDGYI